jgi:hypothetical protein
MRVGERGCGFWWLRDQYSTMLSAGENLLHVSCLVLCTRAMRYHAEGEPWPALGSKVMQAVALDKSVPN